MNEENLLENVYKARFTYFSGNVNNPIPYQGTCFGIKVKIIDQETKSWVNKNYYVTNRHCVDYFGFDENKDERKLQLDQIEITHRWRDKHNNLKQETLDTVIDKSAKILVHENRYNDIALIEADLKTPKPPFETWTLDSDRIPDKQNFHAHAKMFDNIFFMGFPGSVWDGENHLAIGRNALVSSLSDLNYSPENQKNNKADRVLLSGMSFSGSSGSVVTDRNGGILGVMSGHYAYENKDGKLLWTHDSLDDDGKRPIIKQTHAGLSYFIKGYVIREILSNPIELNWGANPSDWDNDISDWKN